MIELNCTLRLALRPADGGWQILDKTDWSQAGRIELDAGDRISNFEIVSERRRQGLGTEAFDCLARTFPNCIPEAISGPEGWLRKLGYGDGKSPLSRQQSNLTGARRREQLLAQARRHCRRLCEELGVPANYASRSGLLLQLEPDRLLEAGIDVSDRPLYLEPDTAHAWLRMKSAAASDDVNLQAVSGFRGLGYQAALVRRKLDNGQSIEQILKVSAAPGYSEHHSGRALDLTTPDSALLDEEFEHTAGFDWLTRRAQSFGFSLSYPRGNPHGIAYEPWHWAYHD